jgi:hypothetical protein
MKADKSFGIWAGKISRRDKRQHHRLARKLMVNAKASRFDFLCVDYGNLADSLTGDDRPVMLPRDAENGGGNDERNL